MELMQLLVENDLRKDVELQSELGHALDGGALSCER